MHFSKRFSRRRQNLNPAHPRIDRVRHDNVCHSEVVTCHHYATFRWARRPRAEEFFVAILREAKRYPKDTRSIQVGCPIVGAIVLLDGAEVDTAR